MQWPGKHHPFTSSLFFFLLFFNFNNDVIYIRSRSQSALPQNQGWGSAAAPRPAASNQQLEFTVGSSTRPTSSLHRGGRVNLMEPHPPGPAAPQSKMEVSSFYIERKIFLSH